MRTGKTPEFAPTWSTEQDSPESGRSSRPANLPTSTHFEVPQGMPANWATTRAISREGSHSAPSQETHPAYRRSIFSPPPYESPLARHFAATIGAQSATGQQPAASAPESQAGQARRETHEADSVGSNTNSEGPSTDITARRRVQNRLAQRRYRRKQQAEINAARASNRQHDTNVDRARQMFGPNANGSDYDVAAEMALQAARNNSVVWYWIRMRIDNEIRARNGTSQSANPSSDPSVSQRPD